MAKHVAWRSWLGAALLGGLGSCTAAPRPHLVFNDFENLAGWVPPAQLTTAHAYSGRYAARVAGPADQSVAFQLPLAHLAGSNRLRFSAQLWLGRSAERYPAVVAQVWHEHNVIHTQYLRLGEVVTRYDQWVPVTMLLTLPGDVNDQDELRIFVEPGPPASPLLLDDFTLDDAR